MTLPLTTTPAQVVAPVGETPPVQEVPQDQAMTYNEGNGVQDTIVMTGPLSEIYTRALGVYFAKKPLDPQAMASESQALDNIRDTAISQSTDIGLREIAGAVTMQLPQEVIGNPDATVFAVDHTQIDRPEVIDALSRLRDRAGAAGQDYVLMAGCVEPLKEVVPMWMGTNKNYEITTLESNPPTGVDRSFARATESYCESLGFPVVYGMEGLATWIIERNRAKQGLAAESMNIAQETYRTSMPNEDRRPLRDRKIAQEGLLGGAAKKIKSWLAGKPAVVEKSLLEKATEALQGDTPVTLTLENRYFGQAESNADLMKALSELDSYINKSVGHSAALNKNMIRSLDMLVELNKGVDRGENADQSVAESNYKKLFPKCKPIYEEYVKLTQQVYLPHRGAKDKFGYRVSLSKDGMGYRIRNPEEFSSIYAEPNLDIVDDFSGNPMVMGPFSAGIYPSNHLGGKTTWTLTDAEKQKLLALIQKWVPIIAKLFDDKEIIKDHPATMLTSEHFDHDPDDEEGWVRCVHGLTDWTVEDIWQGIPWEFIYGMDVVVGQIIGNLRTAKGNTIAQEGFIGDWYRKVVKRMSDNKELRDSENAKKKAEARIKALEKLKGTQHDTAQNKMERAKIKIGNLITSWEDAPTNVMIRFGTAKSLKDANKVLDWYASVFSSAVDIAKTNLANQAKIIEAYNVLLTESPDLKKAGTSIDSVMAAVYKQQPGLYKGMTITKDGKRELLSGPFGCVFLSTPGGGNGIFENDPEDDVLDGDLYVYMHPVAWAYGYQETDSGEVDDFDVSSQEYKAFLEKCMHVMELIQKADAQLADIDPDGEFRKVMGTLDKMEDKYPDSTYDLAKAYYRSGYIWGLNMLLDTATSSIAFIRAEKIKGK